MLLLIRQPLGTAALLSLLGSGLWSAEVLAFAGFQAQLSGRIAWDASAFDERCPAGETPAGGHQRQPALRVSEKANCHILGTLARQLVQFIAADDACCLSRLELAGWQDVAESSWSFPAPHAEPAKLISARSWAVTLPDTAVIYGGGADRG